MMESPEINDRINAHIQEELPRAAENMHHNIQRQPRNTRGVHHNGQPLKQRN
jgi:hypothetical protein